MYVGLYIMTKNKDYPKSPIFVTQKDLDNAVLKLKECKENVKNYKEILKETITRIESWNDDLYDDREKSYQEEKALKESEPKEETK